MENNNDLNEPDNSYQMEVDKASNLNNRQSTYKSTHNILGEEKYNISEIIDRLKPLTGKDIVNEVMKLLKEKKVGYSYNSLFHLEKCNRKHF